MRLLLLFLLVSSVLAAGDGFSEALVAPPALPGEDSYELSLVTPMKETITDAHVLLEITGDEERSTLLYVDEDGTFRLDLDPGEYVLVLKADRAATPGKDYYARAAFSTARPARTVTAHPVGSVTGRVLEGGAAVPDAAVQVRCSGSYGEAASVRTDAAGVYVADWLPIGACRVTAVDELAGYADVTVAGGGLAEADLALDTPVSRSRLVWLWLLLLLLPLALIPLYKRPALKEVVSSRAEDITATLPPKERAVVNYLLDHPGSYQNRVLRATGLPKTTLLRVIDSLERKQILAVAKEGKIKRLKLTDWFLGK